MRIFFLSFIASLQLAGAHAACSRPIRVPAAPLGQTIVIGEDPTIISGIYPELLKRYGKKMGCEFIFVKVPWVRAEILVKTGAADMFLLAMRVPERDIWGRFVPLVTSHWTLITLRNDPSPTTVEGLLALPNIRFNAINGFKYGTKHQNMLDRLMQKGEMEYVVDPATIVRKMVAGRVDYVFLPSYTFAGALERTGLKNYASRAHYSFLSDIPPTVAGAYFSPYLAKNDSEQLFSLLSKMRDDGAILLEMKRIFSADKLISIKPLPNER